MAVGGGGRERVGKCSWFCKGDGADRVQWVFVRYRISDTTRDAPVTLWAAAAPTLMKGSRDSSELGAERVQPGPGLSTGTLPLLTSHTRFPSGRQSYSIPEVKQIPSPKGTQSVIFFSSAFFCC